MTGPEGEQGWHERDPGDGVPDAGGVRPAPWRLRLTNAAFGIRSGEGRTAWLLFLHFAILATCHYAGKSVRNATYIDTLGAIRLPYVYLLVALVSVPVLAVYSRLARRAREDRLIVGWTLIQAVGLAVFWQLYERFGAEAWVATAFYVCLTIGFGVAVSQFWLFANRVFDARQARRLFGFIGAGGLAGSVLGGQLASGVSGRFGTNATLLVAAVLMVGVAVTAVLAESARHGSSPGTGHPRAPRWREARGGLSAVRSSRLLGAIALLMLLAVITGQMVDIQFNWVIQGATETLDQRTATFGFFYSIMGLVAFIFQLFFTQRIHRVLGVGFAMKVMPATVGMGTMALILAVLAAPAALLPAAWALKLGESGLRHSLDQATRELLFVPVPRTIRTSAKAFIDVFVQRAAKGVGAVVLLTVSFGILSMHGVSWLTLAFTVGWFAAAVAARREYVAAFRSGLKSEVSGELPEMEMGDVDTVTRLIENLGSADPRLVLHSLDLLARHDRRRLVPPLLLRHGDAEVRRRMLQILGEERRMEALPLIEEALEDEQPAVRSEALRALGAIARRDIFKVLEPLLGSPHHRVRTVAVEELLRAGPERLRRQASDVLESMAVDGDPAVRAEAARVVSEMRPAEGRELLVQLLYDPDPEVVRAAIRAVGRRVSDGDNTPLYTPVLLSLTRNRRFKHDARDALVAHGERAVAPLVRFMNDPEEQIWVRRAVPKTLARLCPGPALAALVDALDATDSVLRHKAIEALASLRKHQPDVSVPGEVVQHQARFEAKRYLRALADLWSVGVLREGRLEASRIRWAGSGRVPTLLQQLLAERMSGSVESTFHILALSLDPRDVGAARRSFDGLSAGARARALEFLDNSLAGTLRRDVFMVLGDASAEEKLGQARQLYGIAMEPPETVLRRLMKVDLEADCAAAGSCLASVYTVGSERIEALYPVVDRIARTSSDAWVAETARWVVSRTAGSASGRGTEPGEDRAMEKMPLIEKVTFLQGVELFNFCTAEQILQLAAIANEERFSARGVIFRAGEPASALFGVIEGQVEVRGPGEGRSVIGRLETFGIRDILAGRVRTATAKALESGRALVLETEDLFDLMANNIQIVKALFRTLTEVAEGRGGRVLR